ncbi:sulfotransferase 2B1-like [Engraulis encrasicolus]|uniref:sulfotransferase 2B1-like n=1 Tax=Engraulis encrasicolus TaxID=184585 RepID=UPI002FCEEBF1
MEPYMDYHGLPLPSIAHSQDSLKYFENFQVKDDDVFAITYPKSGTTWMQEILPLILNGGDLTPVKTIPNWDRVPWLEETRAAQVMDNLSSPRLMVSHMPYNLMPASFFSSKAKVIYVARNPKDVMVSSYFFHQMASFLDDPGTFDEFMDKFLAGQVLFGKWTEHVKSWKEADLGDRILHITYDEMVQDLKGAVKRFSDFLGCEMSEETLQKVASHCSFNSMKTNSMSNYSMVPQEVMDTNKSAFLRKGISGDWKNHFTPEQESKFSTAIMKELGGSHIKFPWDAEPL